jgi:hypothetical protein
VTTLEVADFESVTAPEDAEKSPGAFAEPGAVDQLTWRAQHNFGGGATWIVKEAVVEAPVPSATVASEIVTDGVGAAVAGTGMRTTSKVAATAPVTRRCTRRWKARIRNGGKERSIAEGIDAEGGRADSPFRGFSPALEQVETFSLGDHAT